MCNTGLLKADITPRPNNPPLRNEALHVHVHLSPPPKEYPLLFLLCTRPMEDTHTYFVMFVWNAQLLFLLSFVWPGFEPAPLVGAPFFFGRHRGPGFEPAPSYFLFRF